MHVFAWTQQTHACQAYSLILTRALRKNCAHEHIWGCRVGARACAFSANPFSQLLYFAMPGDEKSISKVKVLLAKCLGSCLRYDRHALFKSYWEWPIVSARGGEYTCCLYTVETWNGLQILAAYGLSKDKSRRHYWYQHTERMASFLGSRLKPLHCSNRCAVSSPVASKPSQRCYSNCACYARDQSLLICHAPPGGASSCS